MDLYKLMFVRAILTNNLVRVLDIDLAGALPALVGSLGVVLGEVPRRAYNILAMRLGSAATFKQGKSLYCEVYGKPFHEIVHFVNGMLPTGRVVLALPPECWGDQSKRHFLPNGMNTEDQTGSLLVEFANDSIVILRQGTTWVFLEWDEDQEELLPMGMVTDFQYQVIDHMEEEESSHKE